MGLDCSHDAWHGPYSAFSRFREAVCEATGGRWESRPYGIVGWTFGEGYSVETHPGLTEFLSHSDCDGEIAPEMCAKVADELEALLPKMKMNDLYDMAVDLRAFIDGCRRAAAANEPLMFS